mgnify:CR=1 FL=1
MESHLLQMRGLKQNLPYTHYRPHQVASFTDAWIETSSVDSTTIFQRRIFYRCVD